MYLIFRNNQQYGPYSLETLRQYVESGTLLLHDKACDVNRVNDIKTIKYFFRQNKVRVRIPHNGNLFTQIKDIGRELIFPKDVLRRKAWSSDKRLLLLAFAGLVPLALLGLIGWLVESSFVMFYAVSLYFSVVWGLFFYYFFKTSQVKLKTTMSIFFLSQLAVFIIFGEGLNYVNPFYFLSEDAGYIERILFFVFAVGVTEEITKAIPLWLVLARSKEPMYPQTLVFYGLISGIAFGVFEGVEYQMGVNAQLDYASSFLLNIARLTSLPFLHAIWCGIAGYFSAFAMLYPRYRLSLYFLAIAIPALLHGFYDTLASSLVGLLLGVVLAFVGVVLLMSYLRNSKNYQLKLRK